MCGVKQDTKGNAYSALTVFRCNENKIPEKSCILKIKNHNLCCSTECQ